MTAQEHILFMNNRSLLHEGSEKNLYDSREPNVHILHFKDRLWRPRGQSLDVPGKGVINNRISESIFTKLNAMGFLTHFLQRPNMREQMVRALEMIPTVIRIRNIVTHDLVSTLSLDEGTCLSLPIVEFSTKDGDTLINDSHFEAVGWASRLEISEIQEIALRINDIMSGYFSSIGLTLADISLEFGRYFTPLLDDTQIMLGDEISPDVCTLWDSETTEKLGRDAEREKIEASYHNIMERLTLRRIAPSSADLNNVRAHDFSSKKAPEE